MGRGGGGAKGALEVGRGGGGAKGALEMGQGEGPGAELKVSWRGGRGRS